MTEREMLAAQKRADAIVDKVRDLITLVKSGAGSTGGCP